MCRGLEVEWLEKTLVKYKDRVSNPILDVGSRNINGNSRETCRKLFPSMEWIGLDYKAGEDVTLVHDAHELPFENESIGCVICTNTLEHVKNPNMCCEEIYRVLKKNGLFILIVPSAQGSYHHEAGISVTDLPKDAKLNHYWGIYMECVTDVLLEKFNMLECNYLTNEKGQKLNVILACAYK